jgi:hypothetical protein
MAAGRPERRDFPSGPAKRVCYESFGMEGFFDFRRGLEYRKIKKHSFLNS